jgi:curli biogenesis system outer membrane secretion channel CsgG/outer membrane protein OmpA-like peptidoglycan-associated protein
MAHGHPAISDAARGGLKESSVRLGFIKRGALTVLAVALAGCANVSTRQLAPDEQPVVTGSAARRNHTPLEPAFTCVAQALRDKHFPQFGVAVGDVKDYTGKYSQNEGSTITQGGSLMIYSALGKLGDVIQLQERFDTRIAELELAYTDRRQLGDGRTHAVEQGKPAVPWVPYFGGSILRSNYYIVGGVTELNYNIASAGAEVTVSGVGFKGRTFTMNIGVDLRIVDTRTLVIAKTVSLQKQIVGQEVGAGVYRFFGNDLVDINVGNKSQEPLQLGVRTTIEHGVIELISAIAGVDGDSCLSNAVDVYRAGASNTAFVPRQFPAAEPAPAAAAKPINGTATSNGVTAVTVMPAALPDPAPVGLLPQNSLAPGQGGTQSVMFEFGSSSISPEAMSVIDKMANDAAQGKPVTFQIIARDTEVWPPMQRRELTNQRIKAVTDVFVRKQIQESRIGVTWMAAPTDSAITRAGAGYQLIATLVIGR